MSKMDRLGKSLIHIIGFIRKEIFEILRQPRLILSLVLGPFLILLVFGLGYRNEPRDLRTRFVAPEGSQLAQEIEQNAPNLGPQLIYMGVTSDQNEALDSLRRGIYDVVVVAPADAYQTIQSNQQATFTLYHHEIDPFQSDYINYFGQFYVDVLNRRVTMEYVSQGQQEASTVQEDLSAAHASATAVRTALEAGDEVTASQHQKELSGNVDNVALAVGASMGLLSSVQQQTGSGGQTDPQGVMNTLANVQQNTNDLGNPDSGDTTSRAQKAAQVEQDLGTLEQNLAEFQRIEPAILVSPFRSELKSIAAVQPTPMGYFAPAVLALLLQHLAVTFSALSIVRERSLGTVELFRVSPLTALEALIGKYLAYMIFGAIISAALAALIVYGLKVPMLGRWQDYAGVITAVLFSSLAIGFVISIISQTDSQAVQYSMLVLLTSVFFSGFIMSLDMIWRPVRTISWLLPTTYGSILLRNIQLRGAGPDLILLGGLLAIGVVMTILAWLLMRRVMASTVS
jgi:ABC-2 type transport system permease protein